MSQARANILHRVTGGTVGRVSRSTDWTTGALAAVIAAAFVGQFFLPPETVSGLGVSARALLEGRVWVLVTSIFVHGGLWHIATNISALLAVGAVVADRLRRTVRGTAVYYGFFLLLGVAGALGYAAAHPFGDIPAVGASGAICGLIGAASRFQPGTDALAPIISNQVRDATLYLLRWNAVMVALFWGLSRMTGAHTGIAWEAHLAGYAAGLFLIPKVLELAGVPAEIGLPERPAQVSASRAPLS